MSIRVPDRVKFEMAANFVDTFKYMVNPDVTQMRLFDSVVYQLFGVSYKREQYRLVAAVFDTYSHRVDRINMVYMEYRVSKRFVDACTWLWVFFEGPQEYLKRNGHLPVDIWYFAYLAFNNEWDDLEPLLNMEI